MSSNEETRRAGRPAGTWGFLTNHAHVLLCVARDPRSRARDIADRVGITERAAQRILADLIVEGYVTRTKVGRRNHYVVDTRGHLLDLTGGSWFKQSETYSQEAVWPKRWKWHWL